MEDPSEEVKSLLAHFYLSYFPKRSSFELPEHLENKFLYIDEYRAAKTRFTRLRLLMILCFIILVLCLVSDWCCTSDVEEEFTSLDDIPPNLNLGNVHVPYVNENASQLDDEETNKSK